MSTTTTGIATLEGEKEMVITRVFDAPREMVFKLWTEANHIGQWWGPKGFSTTTFAMDVKPGGVWRFVMRGPDGRDYHNKITYREVIPNSKLSYQLGGDKDCEPVGHQVTVTFEDLGGKTRLHMRMLFASAADRDYVISHYGALEGMTQTIGRLDEHVKAKQAGREDFIISRTFDADLQTVFNAWSEVDQIKKWFGRKGCTIVKCAMDQRPGGLFHYCMRTPDGKEMWGKWIFREIVAPKRLVFVSSFSDANAGITVHPLVANWPRETLSTVTFAEYQGKTTIVIRWSPINATDDERNVFQSNHDSMNKGWGGTLEQFAEYLARR